MLALIANGHPSFFFGSWNSKTHRVFILVNLGVDSPPKSVL